MRPPPDPAGVGRVVDRAAHRRTDPDWLSDAWRRGRVVVVRDGRVLVTGEPPRLVLLPPGEAPEGERLFLGVGDDVPYFAVAGSLPELPGARAATLRGVVGIGRRDLDLASAAIGLVNWHARYGFSPLTGEPTEVGDGGWIRRAGERSLLFPRTDPAVIVLVNDGKPGETGRALLARGVGWPEARFSCLAGFVEPGESLEATVAREVYEEVGLEVRDVRYVTSQPWPLPSSLMVAFTAYADPAQPLRPDPEEIAEAHWFTRPDLRQLWRRQSPTKASVAYYLMSTWLNA